MPLSVVDINQLIREGKARSLADVNRLIRSGQDIGENQIDSGNDIDLETPPSPGPPDETYSDVDGFNEMIRTGQARSLGDIAKMIRIGGVSPEADQDMGIFEAAGKGTWTGIKDLLPFALEAVRGGKYPVTEQEKTILDKMIELTNKWSDEGTPEAALKEPYRSIYEGFRSFPISAGVGVSGFLAGAAATPIPHPVPKVIGGLIGAAAGAYGTMYRQAKDEFVSTLMESAQTDVDKAAMRELIESDAIKYGLAEAGPEALSSVVDMLAMKLPVGSVLKPILKGAFTRTIGKYLTKTAIAGAGEIPTEMYTAAKETEILNKYIDTGTTPGEAAKHSIGPTAVMSGLFGLMGGLAGDRLPPKLKTVETTTPPPTGEPEPQPVTRTFTEAQKTEILKRVKNTLQSKQATPEQVAGVAVEFEKQGNTDVAEKIREELNNFAKGAANAGGIRKDEGLVSQEGKIGKEGEGAGGQVVEQKPQGEPGLPGLGQEEITDPLKLSQDDYKATQERKLGKYGPAEGAQTFIENVRKRHEEAVKNAVGNNLNVSREAVESYKGQGWADQWLEEEGFIERPKAPDKATIDRYRPEIESIYTDAETGKGIQTAIPGWKNNQIKIAIHRGLNGEELNHNQNLIFQEVLNQAKDRKYLRLGKETQKFFENPEQTLKQHTPETLNTLLNEVKEENPDIHQALLETFEENGVDIESFLSGRQEDRAEGETPGYTPTPPLTVPESQATIQDQFTALKEGRKPALLLPPTYTNEEAEAMASEVEGFETLDTDQGILIFNPKTATKLLGTPVRKKAKEAIESHKGGLILGYGIEAKPQPEEPKAFVKTIDENGNEIQSIISPTPIPQSVLDSAEALKPEGGQVIVASRDNAEKEAQATIGKRAEETAKKEPWGMTREEAKNNFKFQTTGNDIRVHLPNGKTWLSPGSRSINVALDRSHLVEVKNAMQEGKLNKDEYNKIHSQEYGEWGSETFNKNFQLEKEVKTPIEEIPKEKVPEDLTQKPLSELVKDIFDVINDHLRDERGSFSTEKVDQGLYEKIKPMLAEIARRAKEKALDVRSYLFGAVDAQPEGKAKGIYEAAARQYADESEEQSYNEIAEPTKSLSNEELTRRQFNEGDNVYFKEGWNKEKQTILKITKEGNVIINGSHAEYSPTEFTKEGPKVETQPAKTPYDYGKEAFERGAKASPAADAEFMNTLKSEVGGNIGAFKEWNRGWHEANLKAPVGEKATATTPQKQIADWIQERLASPKLLTSKELFEEADKAFGGTQAENKYNPKDAYDAMELGINQIILEQKISPAVDAETAIEIVGELKKLINKIPTQTKRAGEQDEFQQFSTPPPLAFVVNWAANINASDTVIEPSAGIGGIAAFAKNTGAKVIVNELSQKRLAILKQLPFDQFFNVNAEQLNNMLPAEVTASVVVMNPPFSSTAGRMKGKTDSRNIVSHIEQALKRLEPNGRLVLVAGKGLDDRLPTFKKWFDKIKEKYNVRAVVDVTGNEFQKYGTTFGNKIIIIDNTGKSDYNKIVRGKAEKTADLIPLLKEVRDDRQAQALRPEQGVYSGELPSSQPTGEKGTTEGASGFLPGTTVLGPTGTLGTETGTGGGRPGSSGRPATGSQPGSNAGLGTAKPNAPAPGGRRPGGPGKSGTLPFGGREETQPGGTGSNVPERGGQQPEGGTLPDETTGELSVTSKETEKSKTELSDSLYEDYQPERIKIEGAKPHPAKLVQSAAMAAVPLPKPAYTPNIPEKAIKNGNISLAQIEAAIYAGQAFNTFSDDGRRNGFFIGDGTGVGKGREIATVFWDHWNKGLKKGVWISQTDTLIDDARRDVTNVGWDPDVIFPKPKRPLDTIQKSKGILFTTYSTLGKNDKERLNQLINWLGKDFDGVIAFDESHNMGNAIPSQGERGSKPPALKALIGVELQNTLPNSRILTVSATGASQPMNLAYQTRLGLWGEGTAFPTVNSFINEIDRGGLAAMEIVARDLKAKGSYISRNLSFDGVTYDKLEHTLTNDQVKTYDKLAEGWQVVLANIKEALEVTGQTRPNGQKIKGGWAEMAQFWGTCQRFFNQVMTSMQVPTLLKDMDEKLAKDESCVIQLVNTNEQAQRRGIAELEENETLEDLDISPKRMLLEWVEKSFPVKQYEEHTDENGNPFLVLVVNPDGSPVLNPEAVAMRDRLLMQLAAVPAPDNPMDQIISYYGQDKVGEVSGRKQRIIPGPDGAPVIQPWSKGKSKADVRSFMDGKKKILMFTDAGGTGASYDADRAAKNQTVRNHYPLQTGWRAENCMQAFGRTHRANEKQPPKYILISTNLHGQKRFISSIARRLDQLGALTKGSRQTGSQGFFQARDNLESREAGEALHNFIRELWLNNYPEISIHDFEEQTGLELTAQNGSLGARPLKMTQFMNRLLNLKVDMMNKVFDRYQEELDKVIQRAIENGTLDQGVETIHALKIEKAGEQTVYTDPKSNAQTKYVQLDITTKTPLVSFEAARSYFYGGEGIFQNVRSGKVWSASDVKTRTKERTGEIEEYYVLISPSHHREYVLRNDLHSEKWEKLEHEVARETWDAELNSLPDTQTRREHIITGALLPIWDRLKGRVKVVRVQTAEGEKMIGRLIPQENIDATLHNLGAERAAFKDTPEELINKVLNGNYKIELANGWTIERARVSGENRIELDGPEYSHMDELEKHGVFFERIAHKTRAFIPTGERGIQTLKAVIKNRPVVSLEPPKKVDSVSEPGVRYSYGNKATYQNIKEETPGISDPGKQNDLRRNATQSFSEVVSSPKGTYETGLASVRSAADAAHIAAINLSDYPQEHLSVIITDKNDNILSAYQHTVGIENETKISYKTVAGQALNTPKAANLWLIHNHPGGGETSAKLSQDDIAAFSTIQNLLRGTKLTARDMIAVTGTNYGSIGEQNSPIKKIRPSGKILLVERKFAKQPTGVVITTPNEARVFIKEFLPDGGVVLLNNAHIPTGTLTLSNYKKLRGKQQKILLKEIEKRNATAFIIAEPNRHIDFDELVNLHSFAAASKMDFLDALDRTGDKAGSREWSSAKDASSETFLSRTYNITPDVAKNIPHLALMVDTWLSEVLPKEVKNRVRVELKNLISVKGNNLETTLKNWGITEDAIGFISGATTVGKMNALIELSSLAGPKGLRKTSYHEAFHVVSKWLLPDKDYQVLLDRFKNEEKIADAFSDYVINRSKQRPKIQGIFYKLKQIIKKVYNGIIGAGKTPDQIFEDIYGKRYRGFAPGVVEKGAMLSAQEKAPIFYSQMQKVLEQKLPNKISANNAMPLLEAWAKKGEFKKEEFEWSGVKEWLSGQKGQTVTKQEILDFLKANQIEIREVTKGTGETKGLSDKEEARFQDLLNRPTNLDETMEFKRLKKKRNKEISPTKFSQYTLPGGENYRELLLTLPAAQAEIEPVDTSKWKVKTIRSFEYTGQREILILDENGKELSRRSGFRGTDREAIADEAKDQAEMIANEKVKEQNYISSHWDEPNVLAHIRMNDRTDADGKRVLFLEEIQSDWHQRGKKEGYGAITPEELKELNDLYAVGQKGRTQKQQDRLIDLEAKRSSEVPDAPFKTTWPLLAVKRMIRWAAENGYDRIAWTTGEQQAERYDLSKAVDSLKWDGDSKKTYLSFNGLKGVSDQTLEISIDRKSGIIGTMDIGAPKEWEGKSLSDVIGKDISEKILAEPSGELKKDGLKVGGSGMKVFYDQILPSEVNKYVKKWGGKVGESEIASQDRQNKYLGLSDFIERHKKLYPDATNEEILKAYNNYTKATVHSLEITPAMQKAVMVEGQPMFRLGEKPEPTELNLPTDKEAVDALMRHFLGDEEFNEYNQLKTIIEKHELPNKKESQGLLSDLKKRLGTGVVKDTDLTTFNHIFSLPHWLGKKFKSIKQAVNIEIKAHERRSKLLHDYYEADLYEVQQKTMKDPAKAQALQNLIWKWEGKGYPPPAVPEPWHEPFEDDKDIQLNLNHYERVRGMLTRHKVDPEVIDAFIHIRKRLDMVLIELDRLMREQTKDLGLISEYRKKVGEINNYFPHTREGDAYVQIFKMSEEEGKEEIVYREHFWKLKEIGKAEKATDRARAWLEEELKAGRLEGTMGEYIITKPRPYKALPDEMFFHVPIESLQQLVSLSVDKLHGIDKDAAEDAISKAVAELLKSRGFGQHMIPRLTGRKGIAGFKKDDIFGTLFDYLSGFSGYKTKIERSKEHVMNLKTVNPRKSPEEYKYLAKYVQDVLANQDKTDRIVDSIRGALFVKFLGYNIKSGAINLLQNPVMAAPVLSQYLKGGILRSERILGKAMFDVRKALISPREAQYQHLPKDEQKAIHELHEEGATTDLFLRELKGQLPTLGWSKFLRKVIDTSGIFMSLAEKFNRTSTGLAAYRIAKKELGMDHVSAVDWAKERIYDAHFLYGTANLPELMRGGTVEKYLRSGYTFRTFTHNYLSCMAHLLLNQGTAGKKAFARGLRNLFIFGGLTAIPFFNAFSTLLMKLVGDDDDDPLTKAREMMPEKWMKDMVVYGLPGVVGWDVSGSLNIELPTSWTDILGAPTAFYQDTVNMINAWESGLRMKAAASSPITPQVVRNAMRGIELATKGMTTRSGRNINMYGEVGAKKITEWEAAAKFLGFQPTGVSNIRRSYEAVKKIEEGLTEKKQELADRYVNAYRDKDMDEVREIREEIREWNENVVKKGKPWAKISIKSMIKSRRKGGIDFVPKQLRGKAVETSRVWQ